MVERLRVSGSGGLVMVEVEVVLLCGVLDDDDEEKVEETEDAEEGLVPRTMVSPFMVLTSLVGSSVYSRSSSSIICSG